MALTLRADMCLEPRPSEGYVALFSRSAETSGDLVFHLHPYQGLALALFDGQRSRRDVSGVLSAVLDRGEEHAERLIGAMLRRYRQFLVDAPTGDSATEERPLDAFLFSTDYDFRPKREAAPSALFWVVTEYCDKKCQYCYMNAIFTEDRAPDLDFRYERVCEVIEEAAQIGVNRLILSGGEPFLRPDLIDLIGVAVRCGLDVVPITKARITGARMEALAATGLQVLHVSLDSHRPEMVDTLVGVPGAFDQMIDTIRAARQHGIEIVLRPLLTGLNARHVEGIIELALDLGVSRILMDLFGNTCGRHESDLMLPATEMAWLNEHWPIIEAKYAEAPIDVSFDLPATSSNGEKGCVEGLKGLTFLPDGQVTKCDHWRSDDQLIYGDLRRESILEAWTSDALWRINFPERQAYAGTICYHCKNLHTCDVVRGRCSMSSLIEYGRPSAPDTYCPIGAFERHLPSDSACSSDTSGPPSRLVQLGGGKYAGAGAPS